MFKKIKVDTNNPINYSEKEYRKMDISSGEYVKIIEEWAAGDGNCLDLTDHLNIKQWKQWQNNRDLKFDISSIQYLPKKT